MQKITFEDTTVVKSPFVTIDGIEYEVNNGTYQGGTDLNANTFNTMQNNIEDAIPTIENSLDSDSTVNGASVYAVNNAINETKTNLIKTQTIEILVGTLSANGGELYDQGTSYNIEQGYSCLGVIGYSLSGLSYTSCLLSKLTADDDYVYWSIRNIGTNRAENITLTATLLLLKTS